jgi:hypothetical protein
MTDPLIAAGGIGASAGAGACGRASMLAVLVVVVFAADDSAAKSDCVSIELVLVLSIVFKLLAWVLRSIVLRTFVGLMFVNPAWAGVGARAERARARTMPPRVIFPLPLIIVFVFVLIPVLRNMPRQQELASGDKPNSARNDRCVL